MKAVFYLTTLAFAAVAPGAVELPSWTVTEAASPVPASIAAVVAGKFNDLVVLDGGYDTGLRNGMVLQVALSSEADARLLVAKASAERAVALILELPHGQTLSVGGKAYPSVIRL